MRYTEAPLRREELMRRLVGAGYVSSQQVAADLGVSEMTIRRDLQRLDADGLVHRVAGGAALPGMLSDGVPFEARTTQGMAEKRAIALAALRATSTASSLALDAGTTVVEVASHLPAGLLVASHSVPILAACADRSDLDLIGLGGVYQHGTRSFAGPDTRAAIEQLSVDVVLLSAVAVGPDGLFCTNPLDAETKQLLRGAARRAVLLVDHTKLTASAPLRFATLEQVDTVVTDSGITDEELEMLRSSVREVVVA